MEKESLEIKLSRYMDAGFPILYINTFEEKKASLCIEESAGGRDILEWSYAEGLKLFKNKAIVEEAKGELARFPFTSVLEQLLTEGLYDLEGKVLVFKDIHHYVNIPEVIALLKELVVKINEGLDTIIVLISPVIKIPPELEKFITIFEIEYMGFQDIRQEIKRFIEMQELPKVNDALLDELAMAFKGLTKFEIDNLLALAYSDDGELTKSDLKVIFDQKKQMIMKSGILEMITVKETIEDIGGLDNLKTWLKRKAKVIKNINAAEAFGVDMPKGVLIAGVPGCGKSLNAKAAASLFEVPLLRLDMGRLMGKYVGESENNLRKAITMAEAIAPCVLWIDELEKAFAGISGNSGGGEVTTRLFGNFLTWMQEKTSPVFVVATANNIMALPPELMRKGRFDEIFFVGLPNKLERQKIFEIHISKRRNNDLSKIDIAELVEKSEGYSGADIEGVVKDAIENIFADEKTALTTDDILKTIQNTHSLSEIMKEPLEKMNKEYKDRKFKNASK
ncbi:MAG TPA: AAA family ATPase [Phascolarctobacterium faecium]|uniref:AAA family ATPase n=1 Tax=Phascolarctobacterium faecium TaxID=33025 RepID=UPI002432FDF8|nr:AAA family ATPase [Phascolarctobacterium faecium]HJI09613.1 AAA family ATPase [Phascolarctobacterium faecium]